MTAREAPAAAQLLQASGFRRARLEIGWGQMSYSDPSVLANPSYWGSYITAMRKSGIRPLILLNANDQAPVPLKTLNLTLSRPAPAGATKVQLSSASAAHVVPGLTGINMEGVAAKVLITSVNAGSAKLSRPLPSALAAGSVTASTLRYAPFAPPYLSDGSPNPRFQKTMAGWLTYVNGVCRFVAKVYGSENFDVEVWNELTFGSDFLSEGNYYSPVSDPGSTGNVKNALLQATVQMLRNPANGLTGVQIGDGFSNEDPFPSGATVPAGTAAIDKHPYPPDVRVYPGSPVPWNSNQEPLDASGRQVNPTFTPTFRAFFPEYYLAGIQTETLTRDLSPIQTSIYGTPHGAGAAPPGGSPPAMWITEDGMSTGQASTNGMPLADIPEFQAKAALRFYVSYASEGVQAIDLFAAKFRGYQLIPQAFFKAVDADPSSHPVSLGGLTMHAVGRMTSTIGGAQLIIKPRQLALTAIAQNGNNSQFAGNGTTNFPNLYDRNVLAFFPFQVNPNKFVAAVYVMTRDLTHKYTSSPASGETPYDMPPEEFRLTIGNVSANNATVSLYDPLTGTSQPASIVSRDPASNQIVVQLAATDSPRMLTINDAPPVALTLHAPRRLSAASARRAIGLLIGCDRACSFEVMAQPARIRSSPPTYARSAAHLSTRGTIHVPLRLDSRGHAWLRARKIAHLRVVARPSRGPPAHALITIAHARRGGGRRRHR